MTECYDPHVYWQRRGGRYGRNPRKYMSRDEEFANIASWIESAGAESILDVGAGWGRFYAYLRNRGITWTYQMCDFVDNMRQRCEETVGILPDAWDGEVLPYPNNSFDLVLLSEVLLHVLPKKLDRFMSEMYRVAKRWILVTTWQEEGKAPSEEPSGSHCFLHDYETLFRRYELVVVREQRLNKTVRWLLEKRAPIHRRLKGKRPVNVVVESPAGHIQRRWMKGRFYEQAMLEYIQSRYSGGTFIDVGACMGNHTLHFAILCQAERVIAVEPVRSSVDHLRKNIALNEIGGKVEILDLALSDECSWGKMEKFGKPEAWNVGMYRLVDGHDVRVETLDRLAKRGNWTDVTVLKIDAEWSDLSILRGGIELIARDHPAIFAELGRGAERARGQELLSQFGYRHTEQWGTMAAFEVML